MDVKTAVILAVFGLQACGSKREQDTQVRTTPSGSQGDSTFVVSAGDELGMDAEGAPPTCTAELRQSQVIDPKNGIKAVFSGKLATDCGEDKKPVLYIHAPSQFAIHPGFGCKLSQGHYNVRCQGPLVRVKEDGTAQISISGDGTFDSYLVQMRMTYE